MIPKLDSLPENITAPRTDSAYNCHSYLTKVPVGAIRPFIETFTRPGELIADVFAGSGMTGLAAATLGRRAALSDISVLGQHIARGYLTPVAHQRFRAEAKRVMDEARAALGNLYMTVRANDGAEAEMVRAVWSFTYRCPSCATSLVYFAHLSPAGRAPATCPSCGGPFARRSWPRGEDVPVEVVVRGPGGKQIEQPVGPMDAQRIAAATSDARLAAVPSLPIDEHREMFSRSALGKAGLIETRAFFSARNAIALLELWQAIGRVTDECIRRKLSFSFTAILARASRRYQWGPKRPLNAQNQTYYIAPVYYEWNVFELFNRKVEAAIRADDELFGSAPLLADSPNRDVTYTIASAEKIDQLADASVDYVFTDPPFGSNIFYSDMNLFHEAWIGRVTDPASEAVVHTTGKRKNGSAERYETLLRGAFKEAYRVLKPGRHMSVVFGNSSGSIWILVQRALRDSGFEPAPVHVAILDKGQRSVKGLNSGSEGVVTVDLVLTVRKPEAAESLEAPRLVAGADTTALIREAVDGLDPRDARNPSHVYARVLREAIRRHFSLDGLHLGDVLVALREAGFQINAKTGLLERVAKAA
jgi:16S rRNA G966 N2-methylase RsmD